MAENNERRAENFQIVFLVDVFLKERNADTQDLEDIYSLKSRAISLCVLRLLLHFNSLNDTADGNPSSLKWAFKFYNSRLQNFEYKRRRFYELDSLSFEQFEEEMGNRFKNALNSTKDLQTASARSLSSCLTEILHDFPWVTPDISSPSRSSKNDQFLDGRRTSRNLLFVIGDCPLSDADLAQFLGRNDNFCDADALFKEIFSTALYKEFENTCGLSLFWIDSGLWCVSPDKLGASVKDWRGHTLISSITKKLCGNLIPISSLVQDTRSICRLSLGNNTSYPKALKEKTKTLAEIRVISATFKFSFGKIVEAFLSGKDMIGRNLVDDVMFPNRNGLLKGALYFQEKNICLVFLSKILPDKFTTSGSTKESSSTNQTAKLDVTVDHNIGNINSVRTISNDNSSVSTAEQIRKYSNLKTENEVKLPMPKDNKIDPEGEQQSSDNCFIIKGVITTAEVSPSWMHPTKLYSCFAGETLSSTEDRSAVKLANYAGLFEQLLSLISSKSLIMVIEFLDPDMVTRATGLLQPVTSLCAVLSVVKNEKLLLVERALLRHKSCGCTLVSCDVSSAVRDFSFLPFNLRENKEECRKDNGTSNDSVSGKSSGRRDENENENKIIDSFIRFQKKSTGWKSVEEMRLELKDYYSRQKFESNNQIPTVKAPLTRGKLCQDAAQKLKASMSEETHSQNDVMNCSEMETDDTMGTALNTESERTDAVDEDHSDTTVVQSVDDLKLNLEEGYQKCLNQDQSVTVYVTRTFQMIEHFKRSGELKDINDVDTLLNSTILRGDKNLREISDSQEKESKKERIVLECKLQVYLRLEFADKIGVHDEEKMADEVTTMLRAISFQKDPAYLSSFLKNNILPRYAGNLSSLLRQVYEGLMQRPPKEILSPSQVTSEEDTPLKIRKPLSSNKRAKSVEETHSENSHTLVRRHSVVEVPVKRREIVIPVKGKNGKTRKKAGSTGKKSGKKSSKIMKPVTPVKKARRNLFKTTTTTEEDSGKSLSKKCSSTVTSELGNLTRRHSVAAFMNSRKVADTPVGKQVSKRMLRRQEWLRRRSKTVTDVTIVGESPRKDEDVRPFPRRSPRQKSATFYSASRRPSSSTTNRPSNNSSANVFDDKTNSSGNRSLYRAKSVNISSSVDGVSSPRKKYSRSLSFSGSSSPKLGKEDTFAEVFLNTGDVNEKTILSACNGKIDSRNDTVCEGAGESCDDPYPPLTSFRKPSWKARKQTECSSEPSTTPRKSPCTTSTITPACSTRSMSRRSNSSPSLSTTSPPSPSQSQCSLLSHKSFPTTSPVLFKTPLTTPKSSPINFSPEQLFTVAIPLTPVKIDSTKKSKLGTSPRRSGNDMMTSAGFNAGLKLENASRDASSIACKIHKDNIVQDLRNSETVSGDSQSNVAVPENVVRDSKNAGECSGSVVKASPLLNRKRSLMSSANSIGAKTGKTSKTSGRTDSNVRFDVRTNSDVTTNDVVNQREVLTVSNVGVQRPGSDLDNEVLNFTTSMPAERDDVFKSPVSTKRKRVTSTRTENVSPLNQILKQRKSNRNTSPGTPRGEMYKHGNDETLKNRSKRESKSKQRAGRKARKRKVKSKVNDSHSEEVEGTEEFRLPISEDGLSPEGDMNLKNPRSIEGDSIITLTHEHRNTKLVTSSQARNLLKPQFAPLSLSANSLKHLKESPVLLGSSSPQSSDSIARSLTRKWSERKSPFAASQHSLRKRTRHDS